MKGKLFIEQREKEGDYVIRRPGADRRVVARIRRLRRSTEREKSIPMQRFSSSECATRIEADAINGANRSRDRQIWGRARLLAVPKRQLRGQ